MIVPQREQQNWLAPRWLAAPIPEDEAARLAELRSLEVLDTAAEERFDRLTRLASDVFDVPMAVVSLVDGDRQWFKSACGIDATETPRDEAFCAHAILGDDVLVVADAREDERFAGNPLVTGEPHLRFYAGAPLHGPEGGRVGTLCLLDVEPRDFDERARGRLRTFARLVEKELVARREIATLTQWIHEQAYRDTQTGLPNRRRAEDRLEWAVEQAARSRGGVALLAIRVGELSHAAEALSPADFGRMACDLAARLVERVSPGVTVARWDADEFVIIAPVERADAAESTCRRLARGVLNAVERPFRVPGDDLRLTVTIGASLFPEHADTAERLRARAIAARRWAQGPGSRVAMFEGAVAERFRESFALSARLPSALERGALRLVHQPKVSLATGELVGLEALVRWTEPGVGDVLPTALVAAAEASGTIDALGDWALGEAFAAAARWSDELGCPLPVAVNVSALQLLRDDLVDRVAEVIGSRTEGGRLLELEVTESALIDDPEAAARIMARLRALGVRLSLDDFGTGFSSLSYLRTLPVDALKIDRSFVTNVADDEGSAAIVSAIVSLAGAMGMDVVAEGVETEGQVAALRALGVDVGQGFLLGLPAPADAVPGMARAGREAR